MDMTEKVYCRDDGAGVCSVCFHHGTVGEKLQGRLCDAFHDPDGASKPAVGHASGHDISRPEIFHASLSEPFARIDDNAPIVEGLTVISAQLNAILIALTPREDTP